MSHIINNLSCRLKPIANRAIISSLFLGLGFLAIKTASAQPTYNRFADYCLNYDRLPEATKATVRALAAKTIIDESWDTIIGTDKCYKSEEELLNIKDKTFHVDTTLGKISDLTPLTTIDPNIVEIYLPDEEIQDLRPLAAFPNLERLNLERNHISDLSGLSSLTKLKELNLNYNLISDLSPLSSLTNLEKLNLYNQASAESYWQGVEAGVEGDNTNLPRFDDSISQDRDLEKGLSDISPLASMTGLRELHLSSNKISDVSPLASLIRLETLHLIDNEITDISSLGTMSSLVILNAGKNYIPPEKRVCPIDVESVCDFSEQKTAAIENDVNSEQTAQPSSTPESQNYPTEIEDRPSRDNNTTNPIEEEVRETIREVPGKVFDSLF